MVDKLKDFQNRDIFIRVEYGLEGVFRLGSRVFDLLKEVSNQNLVIGCFFSHYFSPPQKLSQVKVGIRYNEVKNLSIINNSLDHICKEERDIIFKTGDFQSTLGLHHRLPEDIVIDYIICYSFDWLVRIKEKFKASKPSYESLSKFILKNRINIEKEITSKNVFRSNNLKPMEEGVISNIWERFIHHLCNAYRIPLHNEYQLKRFLKSKGINIFL